MLSTEVGMSLTIDFLQLEAELQKEDLTALTRRRSNNRRDAVRNERYCKDCLSQSVDELDLDSIKLHLDLVNTNITIASLLQDAILIHVREEDEHHACHLKMLATRRGLTQQLNAASILGSVK